MVRSEVGSVLPTRPVPYIDSDNRAFWTGGEAGRLMVTRCRACATWCHPPAPVCRSCRSSDVAPEPVGGRGTVMTFTVNVQPWQPEADPYVIAWVQLHESEGLVLTSNVVEVDADDVRIGMEVEVVFEKHPEHDVWYPLFRPAGVK